jgi:ubiquinone/menaquinone biosynthesis C-methylase UbiE
MGLYDDYILPPLLDFTMRQSPITKQREKVVPLARGRVLEIGIGSGLNLRHYDTAMLEKLWGLEPSSKLRERAASRAQEAGIDLEFLAMGAEEIPVDDASCDCVLVTYTLCTIPDVARALREMRRVLKSNGRLIFTEHGRAPDASVRRWQERLNGVWRKLSGGCNLNRDIPGLIEEAGLRMDQLDTMYLPGPRPMTFNYWGTAVPRDADAQ